MKVPAMLGADFDTHFSLDNMRKDAVYALELAASQGLGLPAIEAVRKQMDELCSQGLGEFDYCVLAKPYQGA
jgi:3-hydroxyisobutyrate dehydrogenase/glyoxylate/succinic semialdehyde reductase